MKDRGHWFCENCDDVVILRADSSPARCPVCHHRTAVFVSAARPVERRQLATAKIARSAFEAMRQAAAGNSRRMHTGS